MHIKSLAFGLSLLVASPLAHAFECFRGDVDASSVAHLEKPAQLYFLAPSRSGEVGQMVITNASIRARSAIQWKNTQPIQYKFDAVPGGFVRGTRAGGKTTLESRRGSFALNDYDQRLVILVEPGAPRSYAVEPLGDAECAKVFPVSERSLDDDAYLN